jgi:hypothetical protein
VDSTKLLHFFFAVQEFGMFGWPDWSAKQVRFSRKKISHCMSMSSSADERVASSWLDISQSTWAGLGQNLGNTHPNKRCPYHQIEHV